MLAFRTFRIIVLIGGMLIILPVASQAQATQSCPALVKAALQDADNACRALGEGSVCYGHKTVETTSGSDTESPMLNNPGDQAKINLIKTIHTTAMDMDSGQLGIAAFNFGTDSATMPTASGLKALMLGNAFLDLTPPSPSPAADQQPGFAPLETLYFHSPNPEVACDEAQPLLAIRASDTTATSLMFNSSGLNLKGLVTFHWESPNSLSATVHLGSLDIAGGPSAQAGQTLVAVTDNSGTIVLWSNQRAAIPKESQSLASLSGLSGALTAFSTTCTGTTVHVVAPGETLYRIAVNNNTSVGAIVAANSIANPSVVFVGQKLAIPCASGNVANSNTNTQPVRTNTGQPSPSTTPQAGVENIVGQCNGGSVHVITPNEDLSSIALHYHTTVDAILAANHLSGMPSINTGQKLIIPCK